MDKVLWLNKLLWLIAAVLAVIVIIGLAGLTTDTRTSGEQTGNGPTTVATNPAVPALQQNASLTTVPVKAAYNRTLAEYWEFALAGPYAANPDWSAAVLDPEPVTLFDVNGDPLYYEFYLENNGTVPGYFWTAADKRVGAGIFRIYESPPHADYARIARMAETTITADYPGWSVIGEKPGLYGSGYPYLCTFVTVQNTTNAARETIVVDAYSNRIVPDRPTGGYPRYAESYLDAIPPNEQPDRIARWETEDVRAEKIVAYAFMHGIDPGLPLSAQNTSIIREYYAVELTGPTISPGDTPAQPGWGI